VRDRRFPVVDEERGLVWSFVVFDIPGTVTTAVVDGQVMELPERLRQPRSILLAELFQVVGGEIRHIHAFMINRPFGAPSGW
jgi:hypothetical protein